MEYKRCLWCRKMMKWDKGMYRFCGDCITKIRHVEELVEKITRIRMDLRKELELQLKQVESEESRK